ncbi:uncharacterized protein LOC144433008 [Glandiceps talaboti]
MITEVQKSLIEKYFSFGYSQRLIHYLMVKNHGFNYRFSYFRRWILSQLGLFRKGPKALSEIEDIASAVQMELTNGSGSTVGANEMVAILRTKYNLKVTRAIVRQIVKILDPEGVQQRHLHRLIRREYICKGPNYVWHYDGYDKLVPYGLAIHGCIDGFSRKVIWLKVCASNRDPKKVAAFYVDAIKKHKGCPRIVRADHGTETGVIMTIQALLRANGDDAFADNSYWYGRSTANQQQCDNDNFGNEDFEIIANDLCQMNGWNSVPTNAAEAKELYLKLTPGIDGML